MTIEGVQIEIFKVDSIPGGSPARCKILVPFKKCQIQLSKEKLKTLSPGIRMFIVLHEIGHAVLNSGDEIAVDRWAFNQYKKTGFPLKEAVFALSKVVDPINNSEHDERTRRQFNRVKQEELLRGNMTTEKFMNLKFD